ncbi:pancreatic lipase-related protein 2 isoform X1 [Nasonia vitripennis]|uniref:phospholipase A1 n=2 Tax=Nasonia vitripennis TaxID=7425 RepID=A0A7M7GCE9_NASVI|nr:pancreatic lipase-related protein 2 isoform X1 [Nasonia vitripennis]
MYTTRSQTNLIYMWSLLRKDHSIFNQAIFVFFYIIYFNSFIHSRKIMNFILLILLTALLFNHVTAEETVTNLTCPEFKNIVIGSFFYAFSSNQAYKAADFYLATEDSIDGVKIGENDWEPLNSKAFNLSRKTYFVIHGYRADHIKDWIRDLKRKLLFTNDINLFILDWSSKSWNYVTAVQRTYLVAKDIVKFLEDMKEKVSELKESSQISWNNLYFIGHSLGAHISGQAGRLLRNKSNFFKVERITGLDPAQPCFLQTDYSMKLDKSDADFVDVIHTQTGNGMNGINGLGLQESIGHIDFYVNGGALQPECERVTSYLHTTRIQKMICSHDLANIFYLESLNKSGLDNCKFSGYSWNGSYENALQILNRVDRENYCSDCPEMGINAINYQKSHGKYLVILPLQKPYCKFQNNDKVLVQKGLEELKIKTALFHDSNYSPEDLFEKLSEV